MILVARQITVICNIKVCVNRRDDIVCFTRAKCLYHSESYYSQPRHHRQRLCKQLLQSWTAKDYLVTSHGVIQKKRKKQEKNRKNQNFEKMKKTFPDIVLKNIVSKLQPSTSTRLGCSDDTQIDRYIDRYILFENRQNLFDFLQDIVFLIIKRRFLIYMKDNTIIYIQRVDIPSLQSDIYINIYIYL